MTIDLGKLAAQRQMEEAMQRNASINLTANIATQIFLKYVEAGSVNNESVEGLTVSSYNYAKRHIAQLKVLLEEEKNSGKLDR